jgi:hypothetical protein
MPRTRTGPLATIIVALLTSAASLPAHAEDALKTINNPGGGQIVYGPIVGQTTMPGAMGTMLREVHGHFGDRPQIGKFFQARGSDSVATFFTLTAKNQGNKPIAGLVIVSMPKGGTPTAAVLYDDAARFNKTEPAMMKTLNEAWHTDTAQSATNHPASSQPPAHQGTPQTLHQATAGDRSASIGLAPGWQITGVSGGQLTASGPNGELINLGSMIQQIHDPNMPAQRMPNGTGGARPIVASYSGDLFNTYVSVVNQVRQNRSLPPATFHLISSQNLPATQFEQRVIQAIMEVDLHDGKGLRKGSARIGVMVTRGLPTWAMTINASNAPVAVADAENATMLAMIHSYSQNAAVIGRETQTVINNIHAIGARSAQQAADADARRVASSSAFNQHMDDIDRSSKSFQNYTLDRSQIQDNQLNARGTFANSDADALVKSDPNRFQYVPTQDFLKGVDY